ncbi:LacI family DNA-binding transcriptional regulator [Amycolatopsis sp. NBC_01480]|uniref:LacI family DNA-binding transcriptional regulator n=1 Tax=Amycolatopsis sp. NBC_01480 TaxID=2903562 RepID=UPI002E2D21D6|nr:LacI family DNA-binding transcriptional regulator [Amycolatopsis sp. NBC_01480]
MVTITDVANAAGVAPSTVSYVISGKRSISPETRRLVEQSIRKLGYHPHAGARALASSKTNVLALVVPLRTDLNVAVVMQFVASVVTAARAHDYDLLLLTKDEGPAALQRVASSAIADALIVMDVEADDPRVPMLLALDRPVVLIGAPDEPAGLTCVDLDFAAAGARCVNHLADLGHRSIALVGPSPAVYQRRTSYAGRFLRGFTEAAQARRVSATSHSCAHSYEAVSSCLDELFAGDPGITGLVVHNEAVLPALLSDLRHRGRRVPEDLSVVAICPESMAENHAVSLTTVAIPAAEVGELAVEMTIRHLGGQVAGEVRLLSPQLTQRSSSAAPPN